MLISMLFCFYYSSVGSVCLSLPVCPSIYCLCACICRWYVSHVLEDSLVDFLSSIHFQSLFQCYGRDLIFLTITKTCLYNIDSLKAHFNIVKLGFTGIYIIFVISAQNIDCGYSLEPPRRGGSNEYPQSVFWIEIWKISEYFIWKIAIFWW